MPTGDALDVAIDGRGFFEVLMPDGSTAYTRDGSFKRSSQGELVTSSGYPVQPGIQFPEGTQSVTIAADGTVSVKVQGQAEDVQVGALTLADFVNPAGLRHAAKISMSRPAPAARHRPARPAATAPACSHTASSKAPTSTSSRSWCR